MSQIIDLECNICNEKTQHEIIQNSKITVKCRKCFKEIKGGQNLNYRFTEKDSNAWCNSCKSETYHLVYITKNNIPTIFCTSCGKELIGSRDHKRICGFNNYYCKNCDQIISIFNYIDLSNNNHFICLFCENDEIIGITNECPHNEINNNETDIKINVNPPNIDEVTIINNVNNNDVIPY